MSANTDLPGDWTLHTFFRRLDRRNAAYRNARHYGAYLSGKHDRRVVQPCEPRLLLAAPDAAETAGEVCGFNLLYSGSHYLSAQKSLQGLSRA